MADPPVQRRLAAILAADVAGYSRHIERDEVGTLAVLRQRRKSILDPMVARHHGRVVKVMGDGVLLEFASAVNAVASAVELQKQFATANEGVAEDRRIVLRVGVNLGDVVVEGGDLYGDGVIVAVRLQAMSEPGGVCISGSVHEQVAGKLDATFNDLGLCEVKNSSKPVRVFRVGAAGGDAMPSRPALALPDMPSIAVLPFVNMSNEPEHESFADGLTEDLITDLSRNAELFVIARNSTFAYKGKSVDVRRIARDLGVRYLLEGSARRAAGQVRINVQLIDAIGGGHMWAARFDRDLEDIFAVQDEVTAKIVEALAGRLAALPPRKRPKNMEAYDLCVRARTLTDQSQQASREARQLFYRAIALESGYAEAHGLLAMNLLVGWTHFGEPMEINRPMAVAMAEKALALDPNDAGCHWVLGHVLGYERRWAESDTAFATALALDPNHADMWADLSDFAALGGRAAEGIELVHKALRLNPHPESWYYLLLGQAQYAARQYEAAVETLRRAETYRTPSRRFLAASLAQLGRLDEARWEADMFMLSSPHFTIGHWVATQPLRDDATRKHFVDGYRKAGLPE